MAGSSDSRATMLAIIFVLMVSFQSVECQPPQNIYGGYGLPSQNSYGGYGQLFQNFFKNSQKPNETISVEINDLLQSMGVPPILTAEVLQKILALAVNNGNLDVAVSNRTTNPEISILVARVLKLVSTVNLNQTWTSLAEKVIKNITSDQKVIKSFEKIFNVTIPQNFSAEVEQFFQTIHEISNFLKDLRNATRSGNIFSVFQKCLDKMNSTSLFKRLQDGFSFFQDEPEAMAAGVDNVVAIAQEFLSQTDGTTVDLSALQQIGTLLQSLMTGTLDLTNTDTLSVVMQLFQTFAALPSDDTTVSAFQQIGTLLQGLMTGSLDLTNTDILSVATQLFQGFAALQGEDSGNLQNLMSIFQSLSGLMTGSTNSTNIQGVVMQLFQVASALQGGNSGNLQGLMTLFQTVSGRINGGNTEQFTISGQCSADLQKLQSGLMSSEMWALKMADAMGKLGSGVLEGNIQWLGSYDECLRTDVSTGAPFDGKYCKAYIQLPDSIGALLGGFSPSFGICMPKSCSDQDTNNAWNSLLSLVPGGVGVWVTCQEDLEYDARAIVALSICGLFIALVLVATIIDVVFIEPLRKKPAGKKTKYSESKDKTEKNDSPQVFETDIENSEKIQTENKLNDGGISNPVYTKDVKDDVEWAKEVDSESAKPNGIFAGDKHSENPVTKQEGDVKAPKYQPGIALSLLLAFSAFTNGRKLLSTQQAGGTLGAINGIRFISMTWVILGHTFSFVVGSIIDVGVSYTNFVNRWTFTAITNALLSVDTFFTLSGLLLTYVFMKQMKKEKGRINWFMFYFHRFWRLTPPYMLVFMINLTLSRYFGDGPNYLRGSTGFEPEKCNEVWWHNLLYIQNFFPTDQLCLGWSWYLANDMQFYIISPLILVPLFFWKKMGKLVLAVFLVGSTISAVTVSAVLDLNTSITSLDEAGTRYFELYYIRPYCRMGPYLVGILTGYALYKTDCKVKLNKYVNVFIWTMTLVFGCLVLYGPHEEMTGNPMSPPLAALYNGTSRTIWGACVCWVVFACCTGHGGYIDKFLSWKAFVPLARLTYCAYLVHPIIIVFYNFTLRQLIPGNDVTFVTIYLAALVFSYAVAFITSLVLEAPMMGMEKVIFKRK